MEGYMTVQQAAAVLGLTRRGILWRLEHGIMAGEKFGRDWMIAVEEVEHWKVRGRLPVGRPKKVREKARER
jgi:excisionase family DNA binding protein